MAVRSSPASEVMTAVASSAARAAGCRRLVMRHRRRQRVAHPLGAARCRGDEGDRDPRLGDAEAPQERRRADVAGHRQGDTRRTGRPRRCPGGPRASPPASKSSSASPGAAPGRGAEQQAGHDRGGAAAQPARRPGSCCSPRSATRRQPCSEPWARRRPSRKARIRRFSLGVVIGRGAPSPWALSRIPASSPGNSSARSFRLSAAAKQSKPLPRLALLAGTSMVAMGVGMRPEYRSRAYVIRPRRAPANVGVRLATSRAVVAMPAAARLRSCTHPPTPRRRGARDRRSTVRGADTALREDPVVWLSSVQRDGRPHLVPVWFHWDGEQIVAFRSRTPARSTTCATSRT